MINYYLIGHDYVLCKPEEDGNCYWKPLDQNPDIYYFSKEKATDMWDKLPDHLKDDVTIEIKHD